MMKVAEKCSFAVRLERVLGDIDYKDWRMILGVDDEENGAYWMQMAFDGVDNFDPSKRDIWKGRKWRLSPHMTDSEIVQTALKAVLTAEEHEAREKFLYRGRAIFGPHLDLKRLWELTGDEANQSHRPPPLVANALG